MIFFFVNNQGCFNTETIYDEFEFKPGKIVLLSYSLLAISHLICNIRIISANLYKFCNAFIILIDRVRL